MNHKLTAAVVFGGVSTEHTISRMSVTSVLNHLNRDFYDIKVIGITRDGEWYAYEGDTALIQNGDWERSDKKFPCVISPDRKCHGMLIHRENGWEEQRLDVIFPVLHGKNGEDGTIQGLFELAGIPYVGCGVMASANCMDKDTAKRLFVSAGVPTAKWLTATPEKDIRDLDAEIQETVRYPVFVKPANSGSSIGITKAHNLEELKGALEEAFRHDWKVLLEETIHGRECECAVLGNRTDAKTSAVIGEIIPIRDLYDFEGKYTDGTTRLEIPAALPEEQTALLKATALRAYHALGCEGLSRVDFFALDDGSVILNEINTLPGFTNISMYPKLFMESEYSYSGLLDALIQAALNR